MFPAALIPEDKLQTRYIAPFGLTALLRPNKPGESVESLWIGGHQGEPGIVLFVSALDAEIYRLHSLTIGQEWVRHPLEVIGFRYTVETLKKAWTNLVFGFNANVRGELSVGPSGCLLVPHYQECFGPLDQSLERVVFRFAANRFEWMKEQRDLMGEPDHASTIAEMNALGVTAKGAVQLKDIAEKALTLTKIAPIGEAAHERIDYSTFNPATSQWRYGPNDARQREHLH
ncbi:hypothetical protein [Caballeronia sordidicola]|uniref:hypothetical protein n=1 Tax=Caballeronia sordidicola TaxID=196367 RepID=UPI000B779C6A|nr:hypothetical protein [Caballeronia sordidicola]